MHKKQNQSPNFLDSQKSTYKREHKSSLTLGAIATSFIIILVIVGVVDNIRVSAQEHAQEQQNMQSEQVANNSSLVTERIYIKEVNVSPQFRYDENSIQIVDGYLSCVKDDHILQWQKGTEQWECRKSTGVVFGDLDKSDVVISSAGTIQCKNNGEMLYWDTRKEYWSCGTVSTVIEADLDDSTDVNHNPAVNNVLTFDGSGWINETISDILGQEIIQYFTAINADVTDLTVTNITTLAQTDITGPLTVVGDTNITGDTHIVGDTIIEGNTTVIGNTNVTGTSTFSGPTFLNGTTTFIDATTSMLTVTGTSTLAQTDITGPLTVVGTTNLTGTTILSGPTTLNGTSTLAQTDITGPLTVVGTINMTGTSTFSGPTILNGTTTITSLAGVTSIDTTTENTIYDALDDNFFVQNGNVFGATAILGTNDSNALTFETNNNERMRIDVGGNIGIGTFSPSQRMDVNGSVTANRYYDRNNASYYVDPAGTSMLNTTYTHGAMYVGNSAADSTDIYLADRLYDWDNTGYYLDPGSTSRLNRTDITDLRTDIFYDRNNTAYYVDPASTGTAAKFAGAVEIGDGEIYQSGGTMYVEAPWALRFESSNGMPTGSISVEGAASLSNDFGDGGLWLDGYVYSGGGVGSVHLEGGHEQENWIGQGITIGDMFHDPHSTGNTPDPEANLARVHIKNLTIEYDILPIQTCPPGWVSLGNVDGGGAEDCQQIAGLIVEDGRTGLGTKFPSYKLHVNGTAYAVGAAGALSDERHKKDIITIGNGLDTILDLNPVSYEWIDPLDNGMQGTQFGFVAQEVESVMPSIVLTQDNKERTKGLKYTEFIPLTVKAIQEQNTLITTNTSELVLKATVNSVQELQVDTGNKFVIASEMLNEIDADILELYSITSAQLNLIDQVKTRMNALESDMEIVDSMQTELKNMMIALDADKLVYTNDAGDLTLAGVLNVATIVADVIETSELNTDSVQVEVTGKAAIAGQGVIGTDSTKEITIKTTAIQSDSMVLLTPQSPLTQSLAVSQINCDDNDDNCTGFKVELSETIDESTGFNWFIVNAKKEDIK